MWSTALKVLSSLHQCQSFNFSDANNSKGPWNSSSNHSSKTRPGRTPAAVITVFDIPEILYEILSYLDEPALRRSVVLVCREWYLMSYPLLSGREVIWDDTRSSSSNNNSGNSNSKDVEKVLAKLPGAYSLIWYSRPDRKGGIAASEHWQRLVDAVRRNFEQECIYRHRICQGQERERNRALGERRGRGVGRLVFQSLQKLELGGSIDLGLATATLLPLIPSLTDLELHTHDRCSASLGSVFLACPRLEQLQISSLSYGAVELTWSWTPFSHADISNNSSSKGNNNDRGNIGKFPSPQQQLYPSSLPLRSFVLENTSVELSGLESLLSITPNLQELKLIQLSNRSRITQQSPSSSSSSNSNIEIVTFFPRLKDALKRNRIVLNSFHYSLDNEPLTAERLDEIREEIYHPQKANHWSFWTPADLPSFVVQTLMVIPNVVTTLELHSSKIGRCPMVDCNLHQYLCESPHLLHLKAPRTAFLVDHFDIHRLVDATIAEHDAAETNTLVAHAPARFLSSGTGSVTGTGAGTIAATSAAVTTTTLPPVWKCRNLRTLHIAFRCSRSNYRFTVPLLHLRTRILFGYISRVCPELRDLRIDTSFMDSANYNVREPKMYLAFEGGFCLLSRLHYLERLSIDAVCRRVFYNPWELTWMLGKEEVDREARAAERRSVIKEAEQRRTGSTRQELAFLQSRETMAGVASSRFLSCNTCGTKTGRLCSSHNKNTSNSNTNAENEDGDEHDLRIALENLGQLQDIVEVMDDLDAEAGVEGEGEEEGKGRMVKRCWPHLQKIVLYRPYRYGLSRREEAIEQLVPDSFFQALVRKTFY
ncbi:hypothetical protein EC991_000985 [Linnemannia zychae]|nr:hypothetical protein EC991_000985 [Linnemannia zychae]